MKALVTSMAAAAVLVSGSAFAVDSLGSTASSPMYTYVSVGYGKLQAKSDKVSTATGNNNKNKMNYGLGLGYQLSPNFALESGLTAFGKTADTKSNWNFDLAAKGILPVADQFSLYGKLGVAYVTTKWSNGVSSFDSKVVSGKEHGYALEGALGASYQIDSQLSANLEGLAVGKSKNKKVPGRRAITLGMAYSF